jgi:hypothetical protein
MIEGCGGGIRIQEAEKHVDPVDPDPQHRLVELTQAEDLSPAVVGHDEDRVGQQLEHLTSSQVREHQAHRQLVLGQPF